MDSAFAKINDPTPPEKVEEAPSPAPKDEAQPASIPMGVKYFLIVVVFVILVVMIVYFIVKPSRDELNNTRKEVELMRRNETVLKGKVNAYEEQMRRMKMAEAAEAQRRQASQAYDHQFDSHDALPTEEDYDDIPTSDDDGIRRRQDPRVEDKKRIMAMVNQKRETVADMQQEATAKREKIRQLQEERIQSELEEKTQSSAYKDDKTKEAIFDAVANGGALVDN